MPLKLCRKASQLSFVSLPPKSGNIFAWATLLTAIIKLLINIHPNLWPTKIICCGWWSCQVELQFTNQSKVGVSQSFHQYILWLVWRLHRTWSNIGRLCHVGKLPHVKVDTSVINLFSCFQVKLGLFTQQYQIKCMVLECCSPRSVVEEYTWPCNITPLPPTVETILQLIVHQWEATTHIVGYEWQPPCSNTGKINVILIYEGDHVQGKWLKAIGILLLTVRSPGSWVQGR